MKAKRLLAVLLSIVMTLSVLPAAAFAADRSAAAEEPMRVFHLDCGRKYFTADQIKNLIDEMAQDGYNYMELAVGNDGRGCGRNLGPNKATGGSACTLMSNE